VKQCNHTSCVQWLFSWNRAVWDNVDKIWYSRKGHRWQYGACALHAG